MQGKRECECHSILFLYFGQVFDRKTYGNACTYLSFIILIKSRLVTGDVIFCIRGTPDEFNIPSLDITNVTLIEVLTATWK